MPQLHSAEQLERQAIRMGILPFFTHAIPQFSIEEFTPRELWFNDEHEGPWEWKGPVIGYGSLAYGKLFQNKAAYVRLDLYADLANWRRSQCHPSPDELHMLQVLREHESLLSKELKTLCGYQQPRAPRRNPLEKLLDAEAHRVVRPQRSGREAFDTAVTRLQMDGLVVIADFEYQHDKSGRPYGWGIARYTTPEAMYGQEFLRAAEGRSPLQSRQHLFDHLAELLPQATPAQIQKFLG